MRTVISLACIKPRRTLVLPHIAPLTSNPLRRCDPLPIGTTEARRASTLPRAAGRHRSRMAAGNTDEDPADGAARITDSTESAARPESGCAKVAVQQCSPNIAAQLGSSRYTLPLLARRPDLHWCSHGQRESERAVQEPLDTGVEDLRRRYPGTRRFDYWLPTEPPWQVRPMWRKQSFTNLLCTLPTEAVSWGSAGCASGQPPVHVRQPLHRVSLSGQGLCAQRHAHAQ